MSANATPEPSMLLLGHPMRKLSDGLWTAPWKSFAIQAMVYEEKGIYLAHFWVSRGDGKGQMVDVCTRKHKLKTPQEACQKLDKVLGWLRDVLINPELAPFAGAAEMAP